MLDMAYPACLGPAPWLLLHRFFPLFRIDPTARAYRPLLLGNKSMAELLEASVSKHAALITDFGAELPAVRGSAGQIQQIVINLVTNASEAPGRQGWSHPCDYPAREN